MRPQLDPTQLQDVLRDSARDLAPAGWDRNTGFGLLSIPGALSVRARAKDPQEPNDDVDLVRPHAVTASGTRLATPALLSARLDVAEDPEDVYRVWVPARGSLRVTLRGPGAGLELWRLRTQSVFETGSAAKRDLIGFRRPGAAARTLTFRNRGRKPTLVYADVYLPQGAAAAAQYSLSVATARR
jgi:hypothetical protein